MEVLPHEAYVEKFPDRVTTDMHQPYSYGPDIPELSWEEIKALPAQGFDGLLNHAERDKSSRKRKLEAMLRGLNVAKKKIIDQGGTTNNVDQFIKKVEGKLNV